MSQKKRAAEPIVNNPIVEAGSEQQHMADSPAGSLWSIYGFRVQAIVLGLVAFIFYCNTFSNDWAYDDMLVIIQNEYVHQGIAGIPKIFNADAFESYSKAQNEGTNQLTAGRYRPLSMVTFAIEQQILGIDHTDFSDTSKAGTKLAFKKQKEKLSHDIHFRHVVNVLLFVLSVIVLLYFLRKVVLPGMPLAAFLAALIFTVHPIHTEVVANVKSRDEILSLLFVSLTFIKAFTYKDSKKTKDLVLACVCFLLALLSKEYAVVLVVLLPLAFYMFRKEDLKKSIGSSLVYLAPLAVYFILRLSAVKPAVEGLEGDIMNNPYAFASASEKIASEISILLNYLRLLVFPHPLSSDYTYNQIPYVDFASIQFWLSLAVHGALLWFMYQLIKKRHVLGFAIAFYFVFMLLISNIVVNIGAPMGERLIYHSSVGFVIVLGYFLEKGYERMNAAGSSKALLAGLMVVIVVASGFKTIQRNKDWESNSTLFSKDVLAAPNSVIANTNAGMACVDHANNSTDEKEQGEWTLKAIPYLDKAISLNNQFAQAHLNRGLCYLKLGDMERASNDCDSVQKYFPTLPALAYLSYEVTTYYVNLGLKLAAENKPVEALAAFKRSSDASPSNPDLLYNLAFAYCKNNQLQEGRAALLRTLQLKPDHGPARNLLAQVNANMGIK